VACVKKTNFDTKNKAFYMTIFVFLHRPLKVSVFGETLQAHLDCVNGIFLSIFFDISKYYIFGVEGAYVSGSQI
jgi:hypothetical protein